MEGLPTQRRQRLDKLGFVWDILSDQWEKGFRYLERYKEREAHCRVPAKYAEGTFDLGNGFIPNAQIKQNYPTSVVDGSIGSDLRGV